MTNTTTKLSTENRFNAGKYPGSCIRLLKNDMKNKVVNSWIEEVNFLALNDLVDTDRNNVLVAKKILVIAIYVINDGSKVNEIINEIINSH